MAAFAAAAAARAGRCAGTPSGAAVLGTLDTLSLSLLDSLLCKIVLGIGRGVLLIIVGDVCLLVGEQAPQLFCRLGSTHHRWVSG